MTVQIPRAALATVASAALAIAAFPAPQAAAQSVRCVDREQIVETLQNSYGEVRRGVGLQSGGAVLELYVSEGGGWTLLLTRPDGSACPIMAGEAWEEEASKLALIDTPA